jgi:hypothetical protein
MQVSLWPPAWLFPLTICCGTLVNQSTCYTFTTSIALVISYTVGIQSCSTVLYYESKYPKEASGETESPSERAYIAKSQEVASKDDDESAWVVDRGNENPLIFFTEKRHTFPKKA